MKLVGQIRLKKTGKRRNNFVVFNRAALLISCFRLSRVELSPRVAEGVMRDMRL